MEVADQLLCSHEAAQELGGKDVHVLDGRALQDLSDFRGGLSNGGCAVGSDGWVVLDFRVELRELVVASLSMSHVDQHHYYQSAYQ